jgi:hypothetical protein
MSPQTVLVLDYRKAAESCRATRTANQVLRCLGVISDFAYRLGQVHLYPVWGIVIRP